MKTFTTRISLFAIFALLACLGGCATRNTVHNTLTEQEEKSGWVLLFDGQTTNGWRNYKSETVSDGWQVVDGTLALVSKGGDILTVKQYDSFELQLEWKIERDGNSGIFYRGTEDHGRIFMTAPEYQILDNNSRKYSDAKYEKNIAGTNYVLYEADRDAAKRAGRWNHSRIVVLGNHVEHWLNGVKVVQYELHSDEWKMRVANSKFKAWPDYGRKEKGHIALQDHGDKVWFRNIKIREYQKPGSAEN